MGENTLPVPRSTEILSCSWIWKLLFSKLDDPHHPHCSSVGTHFYRSMCIPVDDISKLANRASYIRILMTYFPMNPACPWARRWHLSAQIQPQQHCKSLPKRAVNRNIRNKPWPPKIHLQELNVKSQFCTFPPLLPKGLLSKRTP